MKKLTMLALAAVFSASAFAQDVFKQISKIKDYKEAYNLIQSNLGSMSAEEKAKCYNKLVDISYEKVIKEQGTETENQMAKQFGKETVPYDTVGLYDAVLKAIEDGVTCDEFDNQPNEKGKVKPKFHKSNSDRLYGIRGQLINAGIYYQNKDEALSYKYLAIYVESADYPLFKEQDKSKDLNLTTMAYYAARAAYFAKDYARGEKFADIALNDTAVGKDALQVKLAIMQSQLKSHEDTLTYITKLKDIYAKDESNDMIFSTICSMYISINDKANLSELIKTKLAKDPNNFTALAMNGQSYMNEHKWDEAIAELTKASAVQPENVAIVASIGNCYLFKAQEAIASATQSGKTMSQEEKNQLYAPALEYLEKAKSIDKDMQFKSVWGYSLYNCCYNLYGAEDPKTKEAEAYTK